MVEIKRCAMEVRNDEKGLAACYIRQKEALKHYIASRIDRPDEAEDVVQDVFERLWKHKDFISPEAVVSLAYKVARNLMADRQRRYRKENDVWGELFYTQEALQDTTEEKVSFKELKLMFDRLVFALPEKRRKAYCLSFFENLTPSEIARELSVSKRTVEQHILLARKDIKTQLQKEYFRYG